MAVDEHLDERGRELLAHRPGLIHGAVGRGHVQLDVRESIAARSEEHTSELQSQSNLVCRLLLEKKKTFEFCRGQPPYELRAAGKVREMLPHVPMLGDEQRECIKHPRCIVHSTMTAYRMLHERRD